MKIETVPFVDDYDRLHALETPHCVFFVRVHRFGIYTEPKSDMWQGYAWGSRNPRFPETDTCPSQGFAIHRGITSRLSFRAPDLFFSQRLQGEPSWYYWRRGHFLVSNARSPETSQV